MALSDVQKKQLERIMKLLQMTEANGCSKAEAENASNLAKELMTKYNVHLENIKEVSMGSSSYNIQDDEGYALMVIPNWLKVLYNRVNKSFGVFVALGKDEDGYEVLYFSGLQEDKDVADYCTESLQRQISELGEAYRKEHRLRLNSRQYVSFLDSCASAVCDKLSEMLEGINSPHTLKTSSTTSAQDSRAVSIYSGNLAKVEEGRKFMLEKEGGVLRTRRSRSSYNQDGINAAGSVRLNGAVNGHSSPTIAIGG
jgi:hypothetical protein